MKVSVIVPAYNAAATIGRTISAVLAQAGVAPFEVVVVDDGSSDATATIIQSFPVKYIYQTNAGPAAARNRGARVAAGEFLFFTDSDCVPHPDWLQKMLPHFADAASGVVAGSYGIANPENTLARCIHQEILYRHHHLLPQHPKVFGSYNFGVRRNVFDQVGGFNAEYRHASGEDNDLSYKIRQAGHKIFFAKDALVDHYHPVQISRYLREQFRHGFWRVKMYAAHPQMARGDDYTFWKDIVEIPLVLLFLGGLVLSAWGWPGGRGLAGVILGMLLLLEIAFAWRITRSITAGVFFAGTMFCRAFVRSGGFFAGLVWWLFEKVQSPFKNP